MTRLPEPKPRVVELPYEGIDWAYRKIRPLPLPVDPLNVDFFEVFRTRATQRRFGSLQEKQLSLLLWYVAKEQWRSNETGIGAWSHKFIPSAGGKHPVDIVVIPPSNQYSLAYLYDSHNHQLKELAVPHNEVGAFYQELQQIVPSGDGTVLWLIADSFRTSAKYEGAESLVWRDAGILLGAIHFVAAALNLNCCAYGVNGDAWVARISRAEGVHGVGGCVVGCRTRGVQ